MNKTELVTSVAEKTNMTKKDAEKAINAVFSSIEEALAADNAAQPADASSDNDKLAEEWAAALAADEQDEVKKEKEQSLC